MRLTDDKLRGRIVISGDGRAIGEISQLFLEDLHVAAIEVKLRKEIAEELGAERGLFHAATLEIPSHMVQSVGDAVILSVPVAGLRLPSAAHPSDAAPLH